MPEAVSAGISLYQAGGLALVLIGIQVAGGVFVIRWLMAFIRELHAELKESRNEHTNALGGVVAENTQAMRDLTDALRVRPCVTEGESPSWSQFVNEIQKNKGRKQ